MRRCKDCEYYNEIPSIYSSSSAGDCFFNPPTVAAGSTTGLKSKCPTVEADHYCSKWEPKWSDSEMLSKAWSDFQLVLKMTKE